MVVVSTEATTSGAGFEGSHIHQLSDVFSLVEVGWLLHGDEGTDAVFEAFEIIIHARGLVHVREFQHDGAELVVIVIDGEFLGQALEAVIGAEGGVDGCELLAKRHEESCPIGSIRCPVDGSIIRPPPEGCMVFEKSSREWNSLGFRDGGQGAELFHLENPCF